MDYNTINIKNAKLLTNKESRLRRIAKHIKKDRQLIIIFLPCLIFYIIFRYGPMYGVIIAFKDYSIFRGINESPWAGLKYFEQFFRSSEFIVLFRNTFLLGLYNLLWTFPFPIIFSVLLNEVRHYMFKKSIQTISYLPSFFSIVIVSGMVIDFLSPSRGLINNIISNLGFEKIYFMIKPEWFRTVYITSGVWQTMGASAIYYIAALSGIDPTLYEAGKIDGCNRFQAMKSITLPSLVPTISVLFILNAGNMFKVGFEKVLLLYNPSTYRVADVFSTFVYRKGLIEANYSYATAVGFFEAIVSVSILFLVNAISKKVNDQGIW